MRHLSFSKQNNRGVSLPANFAVILVQIYMVRAVHYCIIRELGVHLCRQVIAIEPFLLQVRSQYRLMPRERCYLATRIVFNNRNGIERVAYKCILINNQRII